MHSLHLTRLSGMPFHIPVSDRTATLNTHAPCRPRCNLEIDLNCKLEHTGLILLRWIYNPEIGIGRIRTGRAEPWVIEEVEGLTAQLHLPAFTQAEILVEAKIQFVHTARSNISPTSGIAPHEIAEVSVDP